MGQDGNGFLGLFGRQPSLRRMSRDLQSADQIATSVLKSMEGQLQSLGREALELSSKATAELHRRSGSAHGGMSLPDQYDWIGRADPWQQSIHPRGHCNVPSPTRLGSSVQLFHDATRPEFSVRQDRLPTPGDGPSFGLVLEVYRFDGSFVSLVHDLPEASLQGLTTAHFVTVHLRMECEQPLEVYARLNIQHGPNTDQIVRQVEQSGDNGLAEFDLGYSKINEKRLEKAWIDLIFEGPEMNRIALWDMYVVTAPRADV